LPRFHPLVEGDPATEIGKASSSEIGKACARLLYGATWRTGRDRTGGFASCPPGPADVSSGRPWRGVEDGARPHRRFCLPPSGSRGCVIGPALEGLAALAEESPRGLDLRAADSRSSGSSL